MSRSAVSTVSKSCRIRPTQADSKREIDSQKFANAAAETQRPCRAPSLDRVEQHFTVNQVGERLALSNDKVRRMFQDEPGVLKIGEPSRRMGRALKRRYFSLRIPESAVIRVIARMRN